MRRKALAIGWMLVIVMALLMPLPGPSAPAGTGLDKLVHLCLFLVFGWLWLRALPPAPVIRLAVVAGSILLGGATELFQGLLPFGRSAEWLDLAADVMGALVAVIIHSAADRKKGRTSDARQGPSRHSGRSRGN